MNTQINNELIRSFDPCYDPADICSENETLSIKEWIEKYVDKVNLKQDIIWLICRNDFMSDRDLRLFAVWCARSTYQFCETIDQRSIDAVDCSERFANGNATTDELSAARSAAKSAARSAARSAQINQLLTYFK
jgi:hypothetical protein